MKPSFPRSVAVVGSGPSGCYLAQALRRRWPEAEITVLDRLVSPFGLVRYGVAADHQHTKSISRQFDRLFEREGIRFAGNIALGTDVSLEELRRAFSVVALATGVHPDSEVPIPGSGLPQVYGAGAVTRLFNSHPLTPTDFPRLGSDVVIIGGGNVAIDVARLLVKADEHFEGSDIDADALAAYAAAPATQVTVLSRSGLAAAKMDAVMLRELTRIPGVAVNFAGDLEVPEGAAKEAQARLRVVQELPPPTDPAEPRVTLTIMFGARPQRIVGEERVRAVEVTDHVGAAVQLPADSVVTAIGFDRQRALADVLGDAQELTDDSPRISPGVYRTGWLRRGPRGVIADNRACAIEVADVIAQDFAEGRLGTVADHAGYAALPDAVRAKSVDFTAWRRLDTAEREHAAAGRVRRKLPDHRAMYRLAVGRE